MTAAERATTPRPPPKLLPESHPGKLLNQHYAVVGSTDLSLPSSLSKEGLGKDFEYQFLGFLRQLGPRIRGLSGGGLTSSLAQYDR